MDLVSVGEIQLLKDCFQKGNGGDREQKQSKVGAFDMVEGGGN